MIYETTSKQLRQDGCLKFYSDIAEEIYLIIRPDGILSLEMNPISTKIDGLEDHLEYFDFLASAMQELKQFMGQRLNADPVVKDKLRERILDDIIESSDPFYGTRTKEIAERYNVSTDKMLKVLKSLIGLEIEGVGTLSYGDESDCVDNGKNQASRYVWFFT
jgi:hypothetical protein